MNEAIAAAIESAVGRWQTTSQVADRTGSQVWCATLVTGVKVAIKISLGAGDQGLMAAREAEAIRMAGPAAGRVLGTGTLPDGGSWLVTPWWHGPTLAVELARLRDQADDPAARTTMARRAAEAATALSELHETGWSHGAVRTHHVIHTPHGTRLVDLSFAYCPTVRLRRHFGRFPLDVPDRWVHVEAPEIARRLQAKVPAAPTPAADVYALAADVWRGWTGVWPVDYQAAGVDAEDPAAVRGAVASGMWRRTVDPLGWKAFEVLLETALASQPTSRPTAAVFAHALSYLAEFEAGHADD
ncbi:hypothetical protein [Streptomyces sp. NPDC127098]|uniref:hypothetical protein n=1 Tax=Streptomyces sp. NPDC127098 TaxID=3347137 RepID=UPI003663BE8C